MTTATPQRPAWFRLGAIWVALFVVLGVGHVLPALHFAFVAHRLCAEHGELLHERAPGVAAQLESIRAGDLAAVGPALVAGDGPGHGHEHCGALGLRDPSGPPGLAAGAWTRLPAPALSAVPGARALVAHVDIALLSYAPKLAPPV